MTCVVECPSKSATCLTVSDLIVPSGCFIEGKRYNLRSGYIVITRPAEYHSISINGTSDYERNIIHFHENCFENFGFPSEILAAFNQRSVGTNNRYRTNEFLGFDTISFFKQILEECENYDDPSPILIANLSSFLYALNCAFKKKHRPDVPDSYLLERKLIDYVNNNITNQITLDSTAQYLHISTTHVNRLFKSLTGSSLYNYVLTKRLIMAQKMIDEGKGAMYASEKCGFNDYSSFYRLYKKKVGISPSSSKSINNDISSDT